MPTLATFGLGQETTDTQIIAGGNVELEIDNTEIIVTLDLNVS